MTKVIKTQIKLVLAVAVVLFLCNSPVLATIHFKDGGIHDIDYQINDDVSVDYESPGLGTTLNILDGATIPYYFVKGWEDSIINILGGSMDELRAYHNSQATVSGGSIGGNLWAYHSSQATVSAGSIGGFLSANHSSEVTVSGGVISRNLSASDSSQVTVSGGSINDRLYTYDSSQVTVSGGSIGRELCAYDSSQIAVSGGLIGRELLISENAVLTIHGWDFAVDGMPVGYTELYSIFGGSGRDEPHRQLTGILLSGDPLNNQFLIGNSGKIVLVPEPATILLLGLGGLALLRKRRP